MACQGTAILDFGPVSPGSKNASVAVPAPAGMVTWSLDVFAHVSVDSTTADHSSDEHFAEDIRVIAFAPSQAGFTINGACDTITYGQFQVRWTWM